MRALVQRVSRASVRVNGDLISQIERGLLAFVGIGVGDTEKQADLLSQKVLQLRVFTDEEGRMNRSLLDVRGELLVVSQFTLYADTRKGNRPSYSEAARPEAARPLYEHFVENCRRGEVLVSTGVFQAHMEVCLVNDGPVTVMCDSEA